MRSKWNAQHVQKYLEQCLTIHSLINMLLLLFTFLNLSLDYLRRLWSLLSKCCLKGDVLMVPYADIQFTEALFSCIRTGERWHQSTSVEGPGRGLAMWRVGFRRSVELMVKWPQPPFISIQMLVRVQTLASAISSPHFWYSKQCLLGAKGQIWLIILFRWRETHSHCGNSQWCPSPL